MSRRLLAIFVVFLLSFSLIAILEVDAQPRTITVPDDYSTIQDAIEASIDGDTVYVKRGHYDGPYLQTITINKSISLIGEDAKITTLLLHPNVQGSGFRTGAVYDYDVALSIRANDVSISGFTIQVEKDLLDIEEVSGSHDVHIWSLDGETDIFTVT